MDLEIIIRPGEKKDCSEVAKLIKELAVFEKIEEQAQLTAEALIRDGFETSPPFFHLLVAEAQSTHTLVGYTLYYFTYNTWKGKAIHMEDFYVKSDFRSQGIGSKILKALAEKVVNENLCRISFECVDWNKDSITYYKKRGAVDITEEMKWHNFRFYKSAMENMLK